MSTKMIIFVLGILFVTIDSQLFKGKVSSAEINTELEFIWENFPNTYLDPKVMFWQIGYDPSIDDKFVENSWMYTYGGKKAQNIYSTSSGAIKVPTPIQIGLYRVYYCYTDPNKIQKCIYSVPISIIKCKQNPESTSSIEHIITIITENHSFDSIYGKYCKSPTYSNPSCNTGPECCEAIPEKLNGISPIELTDVQNSRFDPCHSMSCEISEINGGKMDKYISGGIGSNKNNFSTCSGNIDSCEYYYNWARTGAMADRFFQSSPGASCQSNMYYSNAKFMFKDNEYRPQNKFLNGNGCFNSDFIDFRDPTIADLLNTCSVKWTFYAEGYNENPGSDQCYPLYYDCSDDPFTYFSSLTESPTSKENFRDLIDLEADILKGTLPAVSYLKGLGIHSEHPGYAGGLNSGQRLTQKIIDLISNSAYYQKNTIVFVVPDESGGYYDHIPPPNTSTIDGMPYGPRTYFVVYGDQVKKNYVSHIQMEPSSIIKFIEWNWLGNTGQLGARDTVVNNLGDLFDPKKTGVVVPTN